MNRARHRFPSFDDRLGRSMRRQHWRHHRDHCGSNILIQNDLSPWHKDRYCNFCTLPQVFDLWVTFNGSKASDKIPNIFRRWRNDACIQYIVISSRTWIKRQSHSHTAFVGSGVPSSSSSPSEITVRCKKFYLYIGAHDWAALTYGIWDDQRRKRSPEAFPLDEWQLKRWREYAICLFISEIN